MVLSGRHISKGRALLQLLHLLLMLPPTCSSCSADLPNAELYWGQRLLLVTCRMEALGLSACKVPID